MFSILRSETGATSLWPLPCYFLRYAIRDNVVLTLSAFTEPSTVDRLSGIWVMVEGWLQELLLLGFLILLLSSILFPPLVDFRAFVSGPPQSSTLTVTAATNVTVWVYRQTGLYYCPDSKLYGKLRPGGYMTQEQAQARGYRPSGGQVCQ